MGTALGITILIIFFSVVGYIVFLVRQHRELVELRRTIPMDGKILNGRAIIDVPTYRETKGEMSRLRAALDRALELHGRLCGFVSGESVATEEDGTDVEPHTARELSIAIAHLKGAAEDLLAAVEKRSSRCSQKNSSGNSAVDEEGLVTLERQRLEKIGESLSELGPAIAGCYFAMSEADEKDIIEEVRTQVRHIIGSIDSALLVFRNGDS